MEPSNFTTSQKQVLAAISTGASTTAAAERAGVHRNSIANWKRTSLLFREAFAHALRLKAMRSLLTDPKVPAEVRLKAANAMLETSRARRRFNPSLPKVVTIRRDSPKVGRNEPCPCGSCLKFKRCCIGKPCTPPQAA